MPETFDVAVIGAGMAGIVAARDLSQARHSVVLLEARDPVGRRTYTKSVFGKQLDVGGAYVHWTQPNVWRELQRHGLTNLTPPATAVSQVYWLADGEVHTSTREKYNAIVHPLLSRLFADARKHFPLPVRPDCGRYEWD